jgi:hypothetical protein
MKPSLDPSHHTIIDRARCHSWRHQLIADRIRELEDLEGVAELALAGDAGIRDAALRLRNLLDGANRMWAKYELDFAEDVCQRIEAELIALRCTARAVGAAHAP